MFQRIERGIEASALAAEYRPGQSRLAFTLVVVGLFGLFSWTLNVLTDSQPGPLSPMIIAVGLATWYGGIWYGALATALGLGMSYFVMDPVESFERPDSGESVHLGALLFVAPGVALLSNGLRSSLVHTNDLAESRRRLLMAVVASEERWRTFTESVPALMAEVTSDGAITYSNAQWMEYTGVSYDDFRRDPLAVAHPDDRKSLQASWRRSMRKRTPFEAEWRIRRSDGAYRWHYTVAIPSYPSQEAAPVWIGVNVDIDVRRRALAEAEFQREMRDQSEARGRLAMLAAHLESWVCEIEDGHVTVMRRELTSGGAQRHTERWEEWLSRVHAQDREALDAAVRDCITQRRELDLDFRVIERNRTIRWMHAWGRVTFDSENRPQRLIAVEQDVTDRKRAEETAREGEEHLRRLADANIIGVASGTGELITDANDNFLNMLGYAREDLAAHRMRREALVPAGDEHMEGTLFAELLQRGASEPRRRDFVRKDGERRHVLVGTLLLERRPFRWVTFNIDLTDQVNAELAEHEALLSAEEANAAKDEFVALVAHELRGPITTIAGNAEVLEKRAAQIDAGSRAGALADIRSEADRLRRMIQDLLVLARLERNAEVEPEPVRVERVLEEVVARHKRTFPERDIEVEIGERVPMALASFAYTDQIVSNLLANAEKYSPRSQRIEIALEADTHDVRVRVMDNGPGIPPEEMEDIFQPFYRSRRTATRAEGFGIGLTVCRRLVETQGGKIWAAARREGGTEFGFTLPVVEEVEVE